MPTGGIRGNRGGQKGRSGRKPSAFTLLKQRIESEKRDDAEFAFAMYVAVMRDENALLPIRLQCADWVANRVLGKLKDSTEHNGELLIRIVQDG